MHAQLITYRLGDISREAVTEEFIRPFAAQFAALDTLVSKVWLDDEADGRYGGFYVWRDQAAMEEFMASAAVKDIATRPYVLDMESADWPIHDEASRTTRGLPSSA